MPIFLLIFEYYKSNKAVYRLKKKLPKEIIAFIDFFKKKRKPEVKNSKLILTDIFRVPHHLYITQLVCNNLSKKYNFNIATYNTKPRDTYNELYDSLQIYKHLKINSAFIDILKILKTFNIFFKNKKSKENLLNFKINKINLGIDIYESILKTGKPTVKINSISTYYYFLLGLKYFFYFEKLFKKKKIGACFLSHDCYIQCGILSKLAIKYKIPLFYVNERGITYSDQNFDNYFIFKRYKKYFKYLVKDKKKARRKSKLDLTLRLRGKVGVKMSYQTESAFTQNVTNLQICKSKKKKILIATHCFYDNPHGYGKMIFPDFWEWLSYIKKIANISKHDWYIKPHRDYLPNTIENIKKVISDSKIKLIDVNTSFHQIKKEGVDFVVTKHGSVGHELPLLGFTVINFGYNPHINYNFNYHCLTKKSFKKLILNNLKPKKVKKNDIYEFFYIHYYLLHDDSYFFKSYTNYKKYLKNNLMNDRAYKFLLQNERYLSEKMLNNFDRFLKLKNKYSTENKSTRRLFSNVNIKFN